MIESLTITYSKSIRKVMEDMSHSVESICKRSNSDFGVINGFFYKAWCLKMESSVIYEGRINNGVRPPPGKQNYSTSPFRMKLSKYSSPKKCHPVEVEIVNVDKSMIVDYLLGLVVANSSEVTVKYA